MHPDLKFNYVSSWKKKVKPKRKSSAVCVFVWVCAMATAFQNDIYPVCTVCILRKAICVAAHLLALALALVALLPLTLIKLFTEPNEHDKFSEN